MDTEWIRRCGGLDRLEVERSCAVARDRPRTSRRFSPIHRVPLPVSTSTSLDVFVRAVTSPRILYHHAAVFTLRPAITWILRILQIPYPRVAVTPSRTALTVPGSRHRHPQPPHRGQGPHPQA